MQLLNDYIKQHYKSINQFATVNGFNAPFVTRLIASEAVIVGNIIYIPKGSIQ